MENMWGVWSGNSLPHTFVGTTNNVSLNSEESARLTLAVDLSRDCHVAVNFISSAKTSRPTFFFLFLSRSANSDHCWKATIYNCWYSYSVSASHSHTHTKPQGAPKATALTKTNKATQAGNKDISGQTATHALGQRRTCGFSELRISQPHAWNYTSCPCTGRTHKIFHPEVYYMACNLAPRISTLNHIQWLNRSFCFFPFLYGTPMTVPSFSFCFSFTFRQGFRQSGPDFCGPQFSSFWLPRLCTRDCLASQTTSTIGVTSSRDCCRGPSWLSLW